MVADGVKLPVCSWAALGKVLPSPGTWWPLSAAHMDQTPALRPFRPVHRWQPLELSNTGNQLWKTEKVLCGTE